MLNKRINRRNVFRSALIGSGAVLIGDSQWDVLWAQGAAPRAFATCRVTELSGSTMKCLTDDAKFLTLKLSDKAKIWMGADGASPSAIKVGNLLDVVSEVDSNGTATAVEVYVNIVNFYGRIVAVRGEEFDIVPYQPEALGFRIKCVLNSVAQTRFMNTECTTCGVQLQMYAQVVGMQSPNGIVGVTRLWLYKSRPADRRK